MKKLLFILLPLAVVCGCGKIDLSDGGNYNSENNNQKKRYKVGDFYSDNNKDGIVISITDDGLHGKIISMQEKLCSWSTEHIATSAIDEENGVNNMKKIQSIIGWREKYPAFAWCADLGDDWYLPSFHEIYDIKDLNIVPNMCDKHYWTSTEYNYSHAYAVTMSPRVGRSWTDKYGLTGGMSEDYWIYVRAIAEF